jgi:hypothetical protein
MFTLANWLGRIANDATRVQGFRVCFANPEINKLFYKP